MLDRIVRAARSHIGLDGNGGGNGDTSISTSPWATLPPFLLAMMDSARSSSRRDDEAAALERFW